MQTKGGTREQNLAGWCSVERERWRCVMFMSTIPLRRCLYTHIFEHFQSQGTTLNKPSLKDMQFAIQYNHTSVSLETLERPLLIAQSKGLHSPALVRAPTALQYSLTEPYALKLWVWTFSLKEINWTPTTKRKEIQVLRSISVDKTSSKH